jgi:cell division protein FtsB
MDKEVALLQDEIDKLELANCEAQHKIEKLEHEILEMKKDEYDMVSAIGTVKDLLRGY